MGLPLTPAGAAAVRALIAREWLAAGPAAERAGRITLRPHQQDAVRRLRAVMARFGGALLADDVGLGKTFVAAAIIREHAPAAVVCPASLRDMWMRALRDSGASARIITYTELSRGRTLEAPPRLLVLDEAHHARTPGTRRYAALATLAAGARVLALSATPIHNSGRDLAALLALFLGARARAMSPAELAECVVRREHGDLGDVQLPALAPPRWLNVADDAPLLREIAALPPPLPPAGAGDGGALVTWGLVRQWASSRAALEGALRRRLARAAAIGAALERGRLPTLRELAAWSAADDAIQLAFPELVAQPHDAPAPLLAALRAHEAGLRALLERVRAGGDVDEARAERLRELRRAHPGERIVCFSEYADTVHALFRRLAPAGGAAALTAAGARVAGGALTRREALARFAPRALAAPEPRAAERIDLLLTTDLLSEGIDLGDASVVVHLDLPWTPARMEQRVGRSRRLGAPHACTAVYALAPPAAAESMLAVERRLRDKLRAAARTVGVAGTILPSFGVTAAGDSAPARSLEQLRQVIAPWRDDRDPGGGEAFIAVARGARAAALLLLHAGGEPRLAASLDGGAFGDDPGLLLAAATVAGNSSPADAVHASVTARTFAAAERYMAQRRAAAATSGIAVFRATARRAALRRVARIAARAPHHRRALIAPLAAAARRVVSHPFGVGAEQVLETLAAAPLADEAWLRALAEFGAIHAPESAPPPGPEVSLTVGALLIVIPE